MLYLLVGSTQTLSEVVGMGETGKSSFHPVAYHALSLYTWYKLFTLYIFSRENNVCIACYTITAHTGICARHWVFIPHFLQCLQLFCTNAKHCKLQSAKSRVHGTYMYYTQCILVQYTLLAAFTAWIERYITHSGQVALEWRLLHIPLKLGERTPLGGPRHPSYLTFFQIWGVEGE